MTVLPAPHQGIELLHQLVHICRMQAGGWFVQDVKRSAALRPLQFGGQFDPLSLASRQLCGRLTQPQIAQPNLPQHIDRTTQLLVMGKKIPRRVDRQPQYIGDRLDRGISLPASSAL